jgi:hypothetical protein
MTGSDVLRYLRELCSVLDGHSVQRTLRIAAATVAIPAAVAIPSCAPLYGVVEYGAPFELCGNDEDDDDDGLADCADSDCATAEGCGGSCADGLDDDGNGLVDCDDYSCSTSEACLGACDDGQDNDADGLSDCSDPDCGGSSVCP